MKYKEIKKAEFIKRTNRFIAHVLVDKKEEIVHVKNTGRCKEILKKGTTVIIAKASNPKRKTKYSLIAAYKNNILINIDSQVPNQVVYTGIKERKIPELNNINNLSREKTFANSRFDLYYEQNNNIKGFIEVKGVTLEKDGIAMFPDAPTVRGTKHVKELMTAQTKGYQGYIFFLIQLKGIKAFQPNHNMDPDFTKALKQAQTEKVKILAYDSQVTEDSISLGAKIPIIL